MGDVAYLEVKSGEKSGKPCKKLKDLKFQWQ
jgi:hypothetical protein